MFKEVLQIIPKLSSQALNTMERTLSGRFAKVAKKFGRGVAGVLMGGGVAGAALGLIDKILNPLKETQDAINRSLGAGDDAVTNAGQFGSSPGELLRLRAMAKSTGLEASDLDLLVSKFQGAIAEANADPNKPSAVRQYANDTNMTESFFQFIQTLSKMEKNQQRTIQAEVFGERQVLKMADFLGTKDWYQLAKGVGPIGAAQLDKSANNLGALNDEKDRLTAARELKDFLTKGSIIGPQMIAAEAKRLDFETRRENEKISDYQQLSEISMTMAKSLAILEKSSAALVGSVNKFYRIHDVIDKFEKGPLFKGIIHFIKGK